MSDMRTNSHAGNKALVGITMLVTMLLFVMARSAHAQDIIDFPGAPPKPLASLKTAKVPEPANLGDYIADRTAAIALGKALFWDMQAGSDGVQACASCHFHAGADDRAQNTVNPGSDGAFSLRRPNGTLNANDFPTHLLANPNDRNSTVLADTNDIVGSAGVFDSIFIDVTPGVALDRVAYQPDPTFNVNGIDTRRVTGRNTPSNINAAFNFRNFWDGRAQNDFNGVSPFGARDTAAYVMKANANNDVVKVQVLIPDSSLASQSVGPALSQVEMSANGRTFQKMSRKMGKKMKDMTILANQLVAPDDSVLGKMSNYPKQGLQSTYGKMIQAAFQPQWWKANVMITVDANGEPVVSNTPPSKLATNQYSLMEFNFSLFWGLAIQMYESTLISDNSRFDQFMDGNSAAMNAQEVFGMQLFQTKGRCANCHGGPEFTNAATANVKGQRLEPMTMANFGFAVYDNGFYNIGVRPTTEDRGNGGTDPFGNSLSESRLSQAGKFIDPNIGFALSPRQKVVADGAFKVPGLRNVELTGPYYHNGGMSTLRQVIDFYNRGGDFHEYNANDLAPDIETIGLTEDEKDALVAFLKALTDERVRYNAAPFDHPQLFVPNGHVGDELSVVDNGQGLNIAGDNLREIPMSGAQGYGSASPIRNFLEPPN